MENWSDAPPTETAAIKLPLILTMEKMGFQKIWKSRFLGEIHPPLNVGN